jgi:hypothetical protein
LAAAVLVGACSGDDEDDAAATTTSESTTPTSSSTTEPPTFTGDPDSAFCALLRDVDTDAVLAGDPNDPAAVGEGFQRLVAILRDASALAPTEIRDDITLVKDGIEALDAALAAVEYDVDALAASGAGPEVTEAVNDPAFTDAGTRLSAYRTQVCGL